MDEELPLLIMATLKSSSLGNFENILDCLYQYIKVSKMGDFEEKVLTNYKVR